MSVAASSIRLHDRLADRPRAVSAAIGIELLLHLTLVVLWIVSVFVLRPVGGSLRTAGIEATGTFGVPIIFFLLATATLRTREPFGWWWSTLGNAGLFLLLVLYCGIAAPLVSVPLTLLLSVALLSVPVLLLLPESRRYFGA